jgi:TolA-binding protein
MNPNEIDLPDDCFINDFQREHYYRCQKENERVRSMHFTFEYAKAQSERMDELVRKQEEEELKRKNSLKAGQKRPASEIVPDGKNTTK